MGKRLVGGMQAPHQHADERVVEQVAAFGAELAKVSGVNETVVHGSPTTTSALWARNSGLGAR